MNDKRSPPPSADYVPGSSSVYGLARDVSVCQRLLSFAAQHGIEIQEKHLSAVGRAVDARSKNVWIAVDIASFYEAYAAISKAVSPVTRETLSRRAPTMAQRSMWRYGCIAAFIAVLVIALSCLMLIFNQFTADIDKQVESNDKLALSIHDETQAFILQVWDSRESLNDKEHASDHLVNSQMARELKENIQKFAISMRQLYSDIDGLNRVMNFLGYLRFDKKTEIWQRDEYMGNCYTKDVGMVEPVTNQDTNFWMCSADGLRANLEIKLPLLHVGTTDVPDDPPIPHARPAPRPPLDQVQEGFQKIAVYQDVREIALKLKADANNFGGSVVGFVLPVLYAALGACAAVLRRIWSETGTSTYHLRKSPIVNLAQIATAVIIGITIGLFTSFLEGSKSLPPLALAFVAGYGVDKFFEFIERVVGAILPSEKPSSSPEPELSKGK
ncbi:hypothetical protein PPMP20_17925 [Paraburkholderia phymatum]|uniref:Transmembrane protein n=1 Tax=Paraburkholderia phymatum (strain DSM 17167 / CIP 108236 / LMG 21445 / STM815) TaxID=391038 RepID=B2JTP4_PARP8|nr:hypothetical protein [Paraburkholderia phymatum]ACC75947.1 hypothetical protein Bphy_6937 [Paraburkholderia phymatum STM815]